MVDAFGITRNPYFFDFRVMKTLIFQDPKLLFVLAYQLEEIDSWRLYSLLYSRVVDAYFDFDRFTYNENIFIELNSNWYILRFP